MPMYNWVVQLVEDKLFHSITKGDDLIEGNCLYDLLQISAMSTLFIITTTKVMFVVRLIP